MKAVLPAPKTAWIALTVALSAHVLLISLAATHRTDTSLLRAWLLEGLAPLEKLVDQPIHGVRSLWKKYGDLRDLRDENTRLLDLNNKLSMRWFEYQENILEAARLRRLLGFAESGVGETVVSRVIGKDASPGHQAITIDRGQSYGIKKDASVLTPDGVVGRVVVPSQLASIVQTLIDPDSAVGVLVGEARQQGIAKGNGSRFLELDYVEDDSGLKEGDTVVTSGLDGVHPKGLPVGIVASVGPRDDGGLFKKVFIRTAVDFNHLEEVLCVVERAAASPAENAPSPELSLGDPAR